MDAFVILEDYHANLLTYLFYAEKLDGAKGKINALNIFINLEDIC